MAELQHDFAEPAAPLPQKVLAALGDLEIAHEELRVAEEELDDQRAQIERLVALHDTGQRWRDHLFALLPVGVLVTDAGGKILETNASAAALLGVRPVHLPGKPLLVFVANDHRRLVRDLLGRLGRGKAELHATVQLTPRSGEPVSADLVAVPDPDQEPGTLRWIVLPQGDRPAQPPSVAGNTPTSRCRWRPRWGSCARCPPTAPTSSGCSAGSRWWSEPPSPVRQG